MKKQAFAVRLPEEVLQAIGKIAEEEDRPRGAVIRRLLILGLKTKEEANESSHREDHSGGRNSSGPHGL